MSSATETSPSASNATNIAASTSIDISPSTSSSCGLNHAKPETQLEHASTAIAKASSSTSSNVLQNDHSIHHLSLPSSTSSSSSSSIKKSKEARVRKIQGPQLVQPARRTAEFSIIDAHPPQHRETDYLFKYLMLTQIFVYVEAGAVPALLNTLKSSFNMSFMQCGALGGVVYLMLSAACPFAGLLLRQRSVRLVMSMTLTANALCTLIFASTPVWSVTMLVIARGLIGMTQAFLMVYSPVWVDEFAPPDKRTIWMSYLQASVPVGIMVGYLIASLTAMFAPSCGAIACWRLPFLIQFGCTLPLAIACYFVPDAHMDVTGSSPAPYLLEASEHPSQFEHQQELSRSILYPQPCVVTPDFGSSTLTSASAYEHGENVPLLTSSSASPLSLSSGRHSVSHSNVSLDAFDATLDAASPVSPASANLTPSPQPQLDNEIPVHRRRSSHHAPLSILPSNSSSSVSVSAIASSSSNVDNHLSSPSHHSHQSIWLLLARLLSNRIYLYIALALSGLYFVVTGVQFWATDYLISVIHGDLHQVRLLFILTAATAPVLGVFFGGYLIDLQGGYQGINERVSALRTISLFGVCACCMAVPACFVTDLPSLFIFLWFLLFFGGCCLPASTGVLISSVPAEQRGFASSVSVIMFNTLGYFLSPLVSAWFMELTQSFVWGFRVVLLFSFVSLLATMFAWYEAWSCSRHVTNLAPQVFSKPSPAPNSRPHNKHRKFPARYGAIHTPSSHSVQNGVPAKNDHGNEIHTPV